MARRSIELERAGMKTPRERIWAAMLALDARDGQFGMAGVTDAAHLPGAPVRESAVYDYLRGLIAAGYVEVAAAARFEASAWRVARRQAAAPQLDKAGQPTTPGLGNLAMWRAMRIRKTFDHGQIAADATQGGHRCSLLTAQTYVRALAHAGYLRATKPARPGGKWRYQLVNDTGPLAPAITRAKVVFDRNTGALVPAETAQQVCDALAEKEGA